MFLESPWAKLWTHRQSPVDPKDPEEAAKSHGLKREVGLQEMLVILVGIVGITMISGIVGISIYYTVYSVIIVVIGETV